MARSVRSLGRLGSPGGNALAISASARNDSILLLRFAFSSRWCGTPTTWWWASSTLPMRIGFWPS